MKIIETTFERLPRERLVIGFEGENLRATVRIDCASVFAEYPNATPALIVKPLFADAYPVVVDRNGTDVDWLITAAILSFTGDGEIQLVFYKGEVICKSAVSKIRVSRSLTVTGEMPDPVVQWIENANRKLAEVDAQIVELEGMVDTATDAATRAEQSASTASTKAEQAAGSAATATEKATEATNAAGTATAKAAEAQTAAQMATKKANAAAESERIATAKAGDATTAAGTATTKATEATEAAQTATEKAGDASASATAAHVSEINAAESADDALSAEVGANAAKRAAEASATQAAQSAQNAGTAAQTATQKAADASASATNAATSATNAATSAETASTKAGEAAQSAQAVAETAEQLADSLEQIEQNTQDIAELDERKANIDGYYPDMTVGNAEQLNSSKFVQNSEPYTLRTSGGSSDIGNREYLDAVVGGTVAWNQAVRDEASENSTDFADVVTVTDAVEDAAGVKVKLEPVQDLHGYDHPWPAGGNANKFQTTAETKTENGVTWTVNTDGSITVSGTATGYTILYAGQADVSGMTGNVTVGFNFTETTNIAWASSYLLDADNNQLYTITSGNGNTPSFTVDLTDYPTAKWITATFKRNNNVATSGTIKVQVVSGSSMLTWVPYSNICPITGWDGVQVWDDPVHGGLIEWNQQVQNGNFVDGTTDWGSNKGTIAVSDNKLTFTATEKSTYQYIKQTLSLRNNDKYLYTFYVTTSQSEKIQVGNGAQVYNAVNVNANERTFISNFETTGGTGFLVYFGRNAGLDVGETAVVEDVQLYNLTAMFGSGNEPSTVEEFKALFPSDYYPYNAGEITTVSAVNGDSYRHYSITLPTEAGTVYGGSLTINEDGTGLLTVDRAEVDLGSLTWNKTSGNVIFFTRSLNATNAVGELLCSQYGYGGDFVSNNAAYNKGDCLISVYNGADRRIYIRDDSLADYTSEQFREAILGVQCVYLLATPITYTLTASQIRTLLGQNNVWADTGDIALTYTGTDEHLVLENGKKYLSRISGTDSMLLGSGQEITAAKGADNVFDLTQMFGTAVADYVYGQGAGFFRKWFGKQWYPYNSGELLSVEGLQSHDMVGFNVFDKSKAVTGQRFMPNGTGNVANTYTRSDYIRCVPSAVYYFKNVITTASSYSAVFWYDEQKNYISSNSIGDNAHTSGNLSATAPHNAYYMGINMLTAEVDVCCISLAHNNSRNGEYAPYEKHSYPLDSSVVLRGIPKVGANGVYWDGDRYLPDGTVERRYGVVDMGTLDWGYHNTQNFFYANIATLSVTTQNLIANDYVYVDKSWAGMVNGEFGKVGNQNQVRFHNDAYTNATAFKAAMQGVFLIYELATPTTETAQPYHSTQWVSDWGTEEFVSTGLVPVGTETRYPANLRDKLQHLPDAASGNGSYLISQTDGQMVLTPFPAPPSTAGNYVLKATVTNGVATYTWEAAT